MKIIKNLFGKDQEPQKPIINNPYEKWPFPRVEPHDHDRWVSVSRISDNVETTSRLSFTPSIIIGLGSTGLYILQEFAEKINHGQFPVVDPRCGMVGIAAEKISPSVLSPFKSWIYGSLEERHLISGGLSNCFIHVSNHTDEAKVNLLIVGSLSDHEFKYLADLIQIIRLNTKINRSILHIIGLFSIANLEKGSMIDDKDLFARMRELNRFQFNGPHWMETPFNEQSGIVNQALIDHVFIVGDKPGINQPKILESVTHSVTDFLALMVQSDSDDIWSKIRAEADPKERGIPLYNTFSLCTLNTPVQEIIAYASIRLASSVLFNENNEIGRCGFFEVDLEKRHFFKEENLATQWLETKAFSSYHPLFQWIVYFENRKIYDLKNFRLELFEEDFRTIFQAQITRNLVDFLNKVEEKDRVYKAKKALAWIDQKIGSILIALETYYKESRHVNLIDFEKTMNGFHEILDSLIQQLGEWEKVVLPQQYLDPSKVQSAEKNSLGWTLLEGNTVSSSKKDVLSVYERLDRLNQTSISVIKSSQHELDNFLIVRFPMIGFGVDALKEVEKVYDSCVHPQTTHTNTNHFYEKVINRIGWDVELSKFENPKLVFVCLPPDKGGDDLENTLSGITMHFSPENDANLVGSLLEITQAIMKNRISEELSGRWFSTRLKEKVDYLSRVNDNRLLEFNFESAMKINPELSVINTITVPQTEVDIDFAGVVYPNSLQNDVSIIKSKQGSTTVAIKFTLDIPVNTIKFYEQISRHVVHESKFRFPQEKNVVRYEQKIQSSGHNTIISPDLARCFVDIKLVSLFCQAFYFGILKKKYDKPNQISQWILVVQPDETAKSFVLSTFRDGANDKSTTLAEFDGLLNAFYAFTNNKPHNKEIHRDGGHMFFDKAKFIGQLKDSISDVETQQGLEVKQEKFKNLQQYFEVVLGTNRLDLHSFYYVMFVEYDYPVWKEII